MAKDQGTLGWTAFLSRSSRLGSQAMQMWTSRGGVSSLLEPLLQAVTS